VELSGALAGGLLASPMLRIDDSLYSPFSPTADQLVLHGSWYLIDRESRDAVREVLSGLVKTNDGTVTLREFLRLKADRDLPAAIVDRTTETDPAKNAFSPVVVPGLIGTLYPYQEQGVAFLKSIADQSLGCILADEMGLGKTLQVIALLAIQKAQNAGPNLIVCPATLLENWRREIALFAPDLSVLIHSGSRRAGIVRAFLNYDAVVVSYETAVKDELLLSTLRWNVLALDEAQSIKNPDAQRTRALKNIPRKTSVAITGTPVENRLTDLWSIADFVLPGILGSKADFELEYEETKEDAARLAPLVTPVLLRREISVVADDLPERIDIPQALTMPRLLAENYERVRREIAAEYGSSATLVALGKLRQLCSHPRLLGIPWPDLAEGMPKYRRLIELCESIFSLTEKAIVFTGFTGMTDLLMEDLPKRFPNMWIGFVDGRLPVDKRQPLIDSFSEYKGHGLLVLNPRAAGVGLNITAANHVIHYTPEWNPAVIDQATARAYRKKQLLPVTVHYLFFSDSVEEVIIDRLSLKRGLAMGAVVGHDGSLGPSEIAKALAASPLKREDTLEWT
jgi:SNF2 family DNA or RNA helicase